jgi:hypothetical protein
MKTNDIYISAKILIDQHGPEAEGFASERMAYFMEKDDVKGASVWLGIMSAINDLNNLSKQKYLN